MLCVRPGGEGLQVILTAGLRAVVGKLCASTWGEGLQVILMAGPCAAVGVLCVSALRRVAMAAGLTHGGWLSAWDRACRYHRAVMAREACVSFWTGPGGWSSIGFGSVRAGGVSGACRLSAA